MSYDDLSGYVNSVNISDPDPFTWTDNNKNTKPVNGGTNNSKGGKNDNKTLGELQEEAANNPFLGLEQSPKSDEPEYMLPGIGEYFLSLFPEFSWGGSDGLGSSDLPPGNAVGGDPIIETELPPNGYVGTITGEEFQDANDFYPYAAFDESMAGSNDGAVIVEDATGMNDQNTDTGGVVYSDVNPEDVNNDGYTDPLPDNGGGGGGGGGGTPSVSSVVDGLLEAIAERDAALSRKQGSLSDRYAEFGDTYITNLNDAYTGLATGDYDSEYEAAKASIWNNIKAQGLLDQTDVDARLGKVNDAYGAKDETINTLADAFTSGVQGQLGGTYDSTLSGLNALAVDGSSPEDYINQTQAINSFDVITPFNEYSSVTPNEADFDDINAFEGFDQYFGEDDLSTAFDESENNVQAVAASPGYEGSGSTISAADAIKSGGRDPFEEATKTSTMKSPFGSSVRMIA